MKLVTGLGLRLTQLTRIWRHCLLVFGIVANLNGALADSTAGVDADNHSITVSLSAEPSSLNTLTAESVSYTAQLMVLLQEGLLRYDSRRRLVGGVAERWEMDSKEIRFWLRKDARWQNGEPVTAADFVFAWQQLLRPGTASPSANLASPILNASEILKGELPVESLGVSAPATDQFVVQLAHPCGWCLKLMTNSIFYPINPSFYNRVGEKYGTSAEAHLANGRFKISHWQRGKQIQLVRQPFYWDKLEAGLEQINFNYIGSDSATQLNLYRSGDVALAILDRDAIRSALESNLRLRTFPTGHLFHLQFSHRKEMKSANINLRKAISYAIDKDEIVNRVVASPGTRVADSMFHDWLTIGGEKFHDLRPPKSHQQDMKKAADYLAKARQDFAKDSGGLQQTDLDRPLTLTMTINDSRLYRRIAEYFAHQLKGLGVDVKIDPQTTQMMVEKWRKGTSDMTLITWPVDVDDPMDQISFMANPDFRAIFEGLYAGEDMAALYQTNISALDQAARVAAVAQVQDLFDEKVTVLPLFESYGAAIVHPSLRGFLWQPVRGYADLRYLRLVP
jgi:oligopeptide transport system substrate-binding protein